MVKRFNIFSAAILLTSVLLLHSQRRVAADYSYPAYPLSYTRYAQPYSLSTTKSIYSYTRSIFIVQDTFNLLAELTRERYALIDTALIASPYIDELSLPAVTNSPWIVGTQSSISNYTFGGICSDLQSLAGMQAYFHDSDFFANQSAGWIAFVPTNITATALASAVQNNNYDIIPSLTVDAFSNFSTDLFTQSTPAPYQFLLATNFWQTYTNCCHLQRIAAVVPFPQSGAFESDAWEYPSFDYGENNRYITYSFDGEAWQSDEDSTYAAVTNKRDLAQCIASVELDLTRWITRTNSITSPSQYTSLYTYRLPASDIHVPLFTLNGLLDKNKNPKISNIDCVPIWRVYVASSQVATNETIYSVATNFYFTTPTSCTLTYDYSYAGAYTNASQFVHRCKFTVGVPSELVLNNIAPMLKWNTNSRQSYLRTLTGIPLWYLPYLPNWSGSASSGYTPDAAIALSAPTSDGTVTARLHLQASYTLAGFIITADFTSEH